MEFDRQSLDEWAKDKPLSILQLDPADRAVLKIADERDAIQKKTFTKWVNKHLKKAGRQVRDLFEDLRDGHNLISLLEVLSGEQLPRDRGKLRFHMLHNVQVVLDFLRFRKIKLVNIRCEDIVDGNPKLTLGLIWTIILHFQISDIVVGKADNLSAKEALLRWARRTTHKYPDVRINNFTTSWKDGLAMVAIIHRNRSDLVDWRHLRQRSPRDRLETAFHVMEREYGVTRLLDPEDVDTPEPDEKSLITYVSQLYEIFPEPPSIHPLFNIEAQKKLEEYQELASNLLVWIREHIGIMKDRRFPSNTVEMKRVAQESNRFRQEEIPPRQRDKNRCQSMYKDIQRLLDGTGILDDLPHELHFPRIESEWNKLMSLFQERDDALHDHLSGADRLQRLAEKVGRDIKHTEITLEEIEVRIEDEARRVDRLHPMDAKRNCDAIDNELGQCEDTIRNLHSDVKVLKDNKYHEAPILHKRVVKLEERYVSTRTLFENRLLIVLNNKSFTQQESFTTTKRIIVSESRLVETNEHFKFLQECINWCKDKLRKLNDSDYGNDLAAVEREYENHQKEHKIIHQFHTNVDQCSVAENNFSGEERRLYVDLLSQLRKTYAELLSSSNKRVSDLFSLLEFLQAATQELIWLNEKEDTELNRDWANKSLNIPDVERYHESLMNQLEKRESQFSAVQDRGNNLVISHHPASKTVEAYLAAMQTQWQWLLELMLCLETHLHHASFYHTFFTDIAKAEQWIMAQDDRLNTTYSVTDFGLDDGEQLLREMQDIREELAQFNSTVDELINRSKSVVPLKQRRQSLRQPTAATAICNYKKMDIAINKGDRCVVHDNSNRVKWRVNASGIEAHVPGVIFTIPPPNPEAIEAAEKLKRQYERCIALWQKKQLRLRQNMIFATIKVVKSWDLAQFIAMGPEQRNAIRRALNEDAEKLIQEGDPNDPQLRRLKREIDEVNRLFDEFERKANEPKPGQVLVEQSNSLKEYLDEMEKLLLQRCLAAIPRDLDLLEQLVIEHKQFENDLTSRELEVESIQKNYQSLSRRTPTIQRAVEAVTQQWDRIWALSHVYIERMKCVEMVVTGIEEGTQVISEVELKLAEFQDLPDDMDMLEHTHKQLIQIQNIIQDHQILIDRLLEECRNVRTLVVKSRPSQKIHPDVDKLEEDVRKLRMRWDTICTQIIERLRSCEAASELLSKYRNGHEVEQMVTNSFQKELRAEKIEDLGPSEAELEAERLRNMYMKVLEKKPCIENVNILGGRFIREAKIYDLRLSQYKESLEELHPSLDASLKRQKTPSGAAVVAKELDQLNRDYSFVADEIYDRMAKIYNRYRLNKKFKFDMSDLVPINLEKTFRTELNLPFEGERSNLMPHDELDNGKILHSKAAIVVTDKTIPKTISATQMLHDPNAENGFSEDSFIVSKKLNSQFFSLHDDYVIHPSTGSRMTVGQAVAAGVLNLALESFQDPASNSTMSFQEAVSRGFLSPELAELFSNPCGVIDPDTGRELTLSEAVKLGLYDPERGSFIDPSSGKLVTPHDAAKIGLILKEKVSLANRLSISPKSLSLYDAVKTGLVDVNTGFVSSNELNKFIPLKEALELGIISTSDYSSNSQILGLADTISQGLINPCTSQLIDKHSDSLYSIEEAITKNIISGNVCEIFTEAGNKVTVNDALKLGILNSRKGSFYDVANNQYLSLVEAYEKQLICRPYSLKDCCDQNLLNENGTIRNPVTNKNRTLLEAVGEGILDLNIKSIKNTRLKCFHNLAEAFMHSVILVEGKYCDTITGEVMSLVQAVHKGFITSVSTKSIFDIEAIKNPETGHYITFNEAVAENIISLENGKYQTSKGEKLTLEEAVARQFIQPQIYTALMMKVGMFDKQENEMTVFDAVINNNLDPKRAFIADPFSSNFIPLSEAVTRALISPLGAATVAGLMNITLSTSTITKTIRRPGTAMDDQTTVVKNAIVFEEELETKPTSLNKEELPQKRMHSPLNEESRSKIIKSDYTDILEISDKESLLKRPESIFDEDNAYDIENNKGSPDIRDESSICHIPSSMKSSGIDAEASFKTDEDQTPVSPDTKSLPKKTSSEISSMVHSTDSAMDTDMTLSGVSSSGIVEPLSISTKVYEIPEDGWYLKEAINGNLFDAVAGLFVVPGTDRLVGFQECIKLGIINPNSADVIDFNSGKITSITKALNKNLLDPFGKYPLFENSEERMTMREAVEKGYIIMKDRSCKLEDEPKPRKDSAKSLYVTSIEGHPEQLQVQVAGEEEDQVFYVPTCQNVQSHSEILNKNIVHKDIEREYIQDDESLLSLISAVEKGKIERDVIMVKDPETDSILNVCEAIEKGIIDHSTGEYKDQHGKKISLSKAAKIGAIGMAAVVGAPIVASIFAAQAVKKGIKSIKKNDPKTGTEITIEESVSYETPSLDSQHLKMTERKEIYVIDPISKSKLPLDKALDKNLISKESYTEALQSIWQPVTHFESEDQIEINVDDSDYSQESSLHIKTSISAVTEYNIDTYEDFSPEEQFDKDKNSENALQEMKILKVTRKELMPNEALCYNVIDKETFSILENISRIEDVRLGKVDLQKFFDLGYVQPDFGKICDIVSGYEYNLREAWKLNMINRSNNILVPCGRCLTIPEIYTQGLIVNGKDDSKFLVLHPECGQTLQLKEAILSEIIDPQSRITFPEIGTISLSEAINKKLIDTERGTVTLHKSVISINEAVSKGLFVQPPSPRIPWLPPLAISFCQLLKMQLINLKECEMTHPLTREVLSVSKAIENQLIFSEEAPISSNSVHVVEAIKDNLINDKELTYYDRNSGDIYSVQTAITLGLLQIKPFGKFIQKTEGMLDIPGSHPMEEDELGISKIHDEEVDKLGETTYETPIVDDMVLPEYMQDPRLVPELVKHPDLILQKSLIEKHPISPIEEELESPTFTQVGNIMESMSTDQKVRYHIFEEDKLQLLADQKTESYNVSCKNESEPNDEVEDRTYTDPKTLVKKSLAEAITTEIILPPEPETKFDPKSGHLNVVEAFNTLFDEDSGKFKDPSSDKLLTFEEAVDASLIDNESLIYDSQSNEAVSVKEAIDKGIIDLKSGEIVKKEDGSKIKVKEAIKLGLLAVVGAPVLAGIAVKNLIKEQKAKEYKPLLQFEEEQASLAATDTLSSPLGDKYIPKALTEEQSSSVDILNVGVLDEVDMQTYKSKVEKSDTDLHPQTEKSDIVSQNKKNSNEVSGLIDDKKVTDFPTIPEDIKPQKKESPDKIAPDVREFESESVSTTEYVGDIITKGVDTCSAEVIEEETVSAPLESNLKSVEITYHDGSVLSIEAKSKGIISDSELLASSKVSPDKFEGIPSSLSEVNKAKEKINFRTAIEEGLIDFEDGLYTNPKTQEKLPIAEAIQTGVILPTETEENVDPELGPLNIVEAFNTLFDEDSGKFKEPSSGRLFTFEEALDVSLIDGDSMIYDSQSNEAVSAREAIVNGLIDPKSGEIVKKEDGSRIKVKDAVKLGLLAVVGAPVLAGMAIKNMISSAAKQSKEKSSSVNDTPQFEKEKSKDILSLNSNLLGIKPHNLYDAIVTGAYNCKTGMFCFPQVDSSVSIKEAVDCGLLDPDKSIVKVSDQFVFYKLLEAMEKGLIDDNGMYIYPTRDVIDLKIAVDRHLILPAERPLSLEKALALNLFDDKKGLFLEPLVGDKLNIMDAIEYGFIEAKTTALRNPVDESLKSLITALNDCDIDMKTALVTDPTTKQKLSLAVAFQNKILITVDYPITFKEAVASGSLDLDAGVYTDPKNCVKYSLEDAIKNEILDPSSAVVKDPLTKKYMTLKEAIMKGLIDVKKKAIFDSSVGKLKSLCILYEENIAIFLREPISFDCAVESHALNTLTAKFTDPISGEELPFSSACLLGLIDPDSAYVKDTSKKELLNLTQALERGIISNEKGHIIDTEESKLYNISKAIENSIIMTPKVKFSLFDILSYNLYDANSQTIENPYSQNKISFIDALDQGVVDDESAAVKCPSTGQVNDLRTSISLNILDPVTGALIKDDATKFTLPEAKKYGYILPTHLRRAMIEKYKQCDATVADMLDGIGDVERRLAEQQPVSENQQGLRNQINVLKVIKETLDEMFRPLGTCLDIVRQVVDQGGSALSRAELDSLDTAASNLKSRYDRCVDQADATHRRLTTASEELSKYEKEIALFHMWLRQAFKTLVEKERLCADLNKAKGYEQGCRDFLGDVIAHQADLRFITMACQKFYDESADHLRLVNNFRTSLPDRYPVLQPNPESVIKEAVDDVTAEFKDLLARATKLVDKVSGVGSKQREYTEALEKATRWLKEVELKSQRILQEPVAGDTRSIQDQLDKMKTISNELHSNSRLFDNCRSAAAALIRSLEGEIDAKEQQAIEQPPEELAERYSELTSRVGQRCQELDSALVQSQGVQEGLDSLMNWLSNVEIQLKNSNKAASLNRDRLNEQIREQRQMHAEIMSHQASVVQMNESAAALMQNSSNVRLAKKIETKLKELNTRYEKVVDKSEARGHHLEQVSIQLDAFTQSVEHFEEWYIEIVEVIESKEVFNLDTQSYQRKIEEIGRQRDARSNDFDGMIDTGKDLVSKKDVTDTALVKDKIKNLEGQWKDLNDVLDERTRAGKERSEQQMAYEQLRDKTNQWLNTMENTVERFHPVALDQDFLKKQFDDHKPLLKEYRDYATTIDKVNELGAIYDALIRGDNSTGRRRSSVTPVKRPSLTPPHKSSDMSPVQKELMSINNRYDMIGMRLNDRQNDLDNMRDELRKLSESMKNIYQALEKAERSVPRDIIPATKEEADKFNKHIKVVLDELSEKQPSLDNLKSQIIDIIKKKPNAPGADILTEQLDSLLERFKELQGRLKDKLKYMDRIKDFLDNHDSLNNWLSSKDKMMAVLGPIASDPRMAQMQAQQVMVLRDEFHGQEPKLNGLNELGDSIIAASEPNSPASRKINDKLDTINNKWTELIGQLDSRDSSLNAASDASKDFYDNYNKLQDKLQKLGDDFDEAMANGLDPAQQLNVMQALEDGLDGVRHPLINLEGLGEHLMSILSDPSSKSDIKSKIGQLNKMYNNLERKLGNKRSEIEASLKDQEEFGNSCHDIQDWLADQIANLKDQLLVSADREVLQRQVNDFEPVYKDLMSKEHEVIMMINKGKDLVAKSPRKDVSKQLSVTLDAIKKEWDNVRKTAVDRRTRLQKCMDTCNKFHSLQNKFLPWLDKAEERARNFETVAFNKRAIDKQIKDLQSFKNDVSRHSGEYENNKSAAEALIGCTDTDHEIVKDMLEYMKERWDHINWLTANRGQELEDISQKLADYNDKARDVNHALQRCEDKLSSHDSLGGGKDSKALDRMKNLLEETKGLGKDIDQVTKKGEDLINSAAELQADSSHIEDEVGQLVGRYGNLKKKLQDRCHDLEEASQAVNQFGNHIKGVGQELQGLDDELDRMGPVGRDIKTVTEQIEQLHDYVRKIDSKADEITDAKALLDEMIGHGFTTNSKVSEDQIRQLTRQLKKIQDRADARNKELESTLKRLEDFYDKYQYVMDGIREADRDGDSFKPVGADVDTIRSQQEEFKKFKAKKIESLGKQVLDCNKKGQGLIQSAASGVNTSGLERDLESMNNLWNSLKEMMSDREKALDKGLIQSGKFQDALDSMSQWLSNFEEMIDNQAPISGEYSVVKAQAQEQKFLRKMLLDRQNEMKALQEMGRTLSANLEPSERANINNQLDDLLHRFDDANTRSQERMEALEETLKVAKEFQNKLNPILVWLDRTDKKLKDMSTVPSDEEKIQRLIRDHDKLHDEILGQKPAFDDLTDVATTLMNLIGDDEANTLADKLQSTTDRYGQLVEDSEALGRLLQDSKVGLRHLVLTYEDLLSWMDEMDARLSKYRILSVFVEKLLEQMDELTDLGEEVVSHDKQVREVMEAGTQLMKHISSDEAIQLKEKLDSIQRRYNDLSAKATDLHKAANEALPLVQQFHNAHDRLGSWMLSVEGQLQSMDSSGGLIEEEIERLGHEIQENRPLVEAVNLIGPQLCQISPGEGASTIETLVTRDNRRFEQICEQIQRRLERVQMSKQRSKEVTQDIDELLDWFREVENQIKEAEPPSVEPDEIRIQIKEHKALNDDIASQKGRVRDVLANSKRVLREAPHHEDTSELREKMTDLKETMESVSKLSSDRLSNLEQALPLAEHFFDTHHELDDWLTTMENEAMVMDVPALRPDQIIRQMERNKNFLQSIGDHKPLLDKLNKTGGALLKLINDEDASKIQDILESDNSRYNSLKSGFRERGQALEDALQETSQFADKLDGMLSALSEAADQVRNAEPISAHPEKIVEQVQENNNIIDDLNRKESAFEAVKAAAEDVINKASRNDPAVKDIKGKLDRLNKLWNNVLEATKHRGRSLDDALALAEKFWDELQGVMAALKDLQEALKSQEPVAVEPNIIKQQRDELNQIKDKIDQTKPEVEQVRQTGRDLMTICGEADKPEVNKNIDDLDYAWDNVTALYAKREENLIDAMEKAMEFHDTLRNMLDFLEKAEAKFEDLGAIAGDIDTIKKQINQLQKFKDEVDPHMVKVESLNRQAQELKERTSPDQAAAIMRPLGEVNKRWDGLMKGIVERQRDLEYALLKLGQFQHALSELLTWIDRTDKTLDDLKPVFGDPQVIEVELAKLKVQINDIQAHQSSVDTLNDAGRQLIEADKGSEDASNTQKKLHELNKKWGDLQDKALSKQGDLENALREAQIFSAEVQDLLLWLADIDQSLSSSKPVAGLPETAREQLLRFMELYDELEENRPKVDGILQQGQDYIKRSRPGSATNLNHDLRTLKQRWESVMNKANDKKIKLEIALKEATEFHDALQGFVDWLTEAENFLNSQQPVSRILDIILQQIEEHNTFKKDVTAHREVMVNLEKKGTHLKYFTQKQDVILIKNLLVSVQHRWEKVVHKAADRTRHLDLGFKEAKEFHDAWNELMTWLDESENTLDELASAVGNDPEKIKMQIARHKEFQKALGAKQPFYDATMKMGKTLQSKAPKSDENTLKQMLTDLKNKWNDVCQKSVDRQRKLEEALLFTGQFKDAIQALLDWLKKVEFGLVEDGPVHGDLDTVMALVEQHKAFCEELKNRESQVGSVRRTADELLVKATPEDASNIKSQISELVSSWDKVERATNVRTRALEEALQAAEKLHKVVHNLLDWLSDAEMKLRYAGQLPDDEEETRKQIQEHEAFMRELRQKELEKDRTIALAEEILAKAHPDGIATIKHWITIIQSRWEEVTSWAQQRAQRLEDHLRSLQDLMGLLDELMRWLVQAENNLTALEAEPLPDDIPAIKGLIEDHKEFMDEMQKKEPEVLSICKPSKARPSVSSQPGKRKSRTSMGRDSMSPNRDASPDVDPASRKSSRVTPDRESSPGFKSRKSSRTSPGREITPTREYPRPWMYGARTTPPREISPGGTERKMDWPLTNMRFSTSGPSGRKGSKPGTSRPSEEVHIRNPKARALWEKWQQVGFMAYDRMRRLYDKLNHLQELEDLKNFSWEEWRKRFMKFMNNKKSRVTDLFRKMDTDNDGAVPRDDFIDGIIKTKFPTSRLEMGTVADIFDRNQDGYIDYQEFIAALRPDWERKGPITDAERIEDEVQKQVNLCTCRQRFRVQQVGEGKYRFGDNQKLCLVRILRSTVMVRVGGGWLALDEFLVKNDPCRAKGRTNVELREQFILAEGVSQSMTPFKAKRSPSSSVSSQSASAAQQRSQSLTGSSGPIIKVRERTAKSVAMGRPSIGGKSDSSYGGDEGSNFRLHSGGRKGYTPRSSDSRGGSRPSSRTNSRPPSRAGSDLSLDSYDGNRSGSMRRTPSFTGSSKGTSSQNVQRSSSLRKGSAPVKHNVSTLNGSSSRLGASTSRLYAPTLSSVLKEKGVRTRIPVLTGNSNFDRNNLSGSATNLDIPPNTPLRSRTSSTTSLSSNHSASKIPILRPKMSTSNQSSSSKNISTINRTRTPSGSSSVGGTNLPREKSGGTDTPTGISRKSGISETRRRI